MASASATAMVASATEASATEATEATEATPLLPQSPSLPQSPRLPSTPQPAPTPTVATTSALPSLSPGQLLTDTATADTEADTVLASEASVTEVSEATDTALLSLLQSPRSLSLPPQSLLSATEAMVASDTVDSATVDSATATDTESNKLKHNNVQATSSSRTRVTDLGG
ncbi:hypothetical protein ISCGN_032066 [Ixodes scapularis]